MKPREAQESFLGEISSLEISRCSPRQGQESFLGEISSLEINFKMKPRMWPREAHKKAFLVKSPAKMWPREAQESFLGEISSLEISR